MNACLNCPNKGCGAFHDKCEKYKAQVKKEREIREARNKERLLFAGRVKTKIIL